MTTPGDDWLCEIFIDGADEDAIRRILASLSGMRSTRTELDHPVLSIALMKNNARATLPKNFGEYTWELELVGKREATPAECMTVAQQVEAALRKNGLVVEVIYFGSPGAAGED